MSINLERFRGVVAIQQAIGEARGDLSTVMNAIVRETSVMPQSNGVVVELREDDQIYYAAASGTSAPQIGLRLPLNASLSGMCVLTGQPLYCSDSETDSRVNRVACRRVGLRSMIVIPIPHQGQTVGVLKYHAPEPDAFDEQDMLMAHLLVGPIAVGMSSVGEADALRVGTELRKLVRMKEQFVSTVSHELRTPVTSIAGSLGLLTSGMAGDLPDKATSLVTIASRNADRLKRLVNDLLDLGLLESGRLTVTFADVDLCAVMRDVAEQNRPFADAANVTIALDVPAHPVVATTDADRLFQALTNLVSNAAKFSPAGSTITMALIVDHDCVRLRVCDQGPGVPEDFRARLFDRFARSAVVPGKDNLPGTGLGLAIVQGIVTQLAGTVRLDPDYGPGAAFEIVLPAAANAASAA